MLEMDSNMRVWKNKLYQLQQEAPRPCPLVCSKAAENMPPQYGPENHGPISRQETESLLASVVTGSYLIRSSMREEGAFTLAIKFDDTIKNYKLYYDNALRQHYVGEKKFESMWDLVADGLIHLYVETRGADVLQKISSVNNYEASPYYQARYYTIQSQAQILRRAAARRDSRVFYQKSSPTLRRQSVDGVSSPSSGTLTSSREGSGNRADPGLAGRAGLSAGGSGGSSSDSIPSPAPASRRKHSKDGDRLLQERGQLREVLKVNNDILDNNNSSSPVSSTSDSKNGRPAKAQSLAERYNLQVDVSQLEKAHNFRTHTFRGPHWCDFCTHFMWGLVGQGVKCQDCGFEAHKKCSDRVPPDCLPDMKRLKRVFGVELTSLVKAENRSVPQVLVKCVSEIERRNGLCVEGLYRVAGFHDHVEDIKMAFDKDLDSVDISPARYEDINTLTSVVKSFLRQLPIPLITYEVYPEAIQSVRDESACREKRLVALKEALCKLPPAHYQTVKYFMGHLNRVVEHQRQNMMSAENLAIVLAPTLLSSPDSDPMTGLKNAQSERSLIEHMVTDFDFLFD